MLDVVVLDVVVLEVVVLEVVVLDVAVLDVVAVATGVLGEVEVASGPDHDTSLDGADEGLRAN